MLMVASDGSRPGRERWRRALILIQTRIIMMTKTKVCLTIVECGNQRNEKYAVGRFFQKSENLLKTMVGRQQGSSLSKDWRAAALWHLSVPALNADDDFDDFETVLWEPFSPRLKHLAAPQNHSKSVPNVFPPLTNALFANFATNYVLNLGNLSVRSLGQRCISSQRNLTFFKP